MKRLLKHWDILVSEGAGFRCLENSYLGVDGDTIDYIGTEQPQAAYDFGLDPNNVMDYDFEDATKNISTYIEEVMNALANAGANTGDTGRFQTE